MEQNPTKPNTWSGKKIIYDFGSNNGDDLPYYLKRSDLVVAVEANPQLAQIIMERFPDELSNGKLIVENCVITIEQSSNRVPFYLNREYHRMSTFLKPEDMIIHYYDEVLLPSKNVIDIINTYGIPFYIKIDIEHYDKAILKEILSHGFRPPYISSEAHTADIFALMMALGDYVSFNLVDGKTVPRAYANHLIHTEHGIEHYSFPAHSAGPFGEDIKGPWLPPGSFLTLLGLEGLGWKDIHATTIIEPDMTFKPDVQQYAEKERRERRFRWLNKYAPAFLHDRLWLWEHGSN